MLPAPSKGLVVGNAVDEGQEVKAGEMPAVIMEFE